jgi:DNA-binding MarR family transcriptional regulator
MSLVWASVSRGGRFLKESSAILIIISMDVSRSPADAAEPSANGEWVGYLLNQLAARIRGTTLTALQPVGLTPAQFRILEVVLAHQPISQVRLGELTGTDRTTMVAIIDRLEELGAAERTRDAGDRRSHAVMITPSGQELLPRARALVKEAEDALLAPLDPTQRSNLRALLTKLHDQPTTCLRENK